MRYSISRKRNRLVWMALLAVTGMGLGLSTQSAAAADPPAWTVVVPGGLDNPRGLTFGPTGTLYVAEAGRGGNDPNLCFPGPEGESACVGLTSKISAVNVHSGAVRTLVLGLVSIAGEDGGFALGVDGVSIANPAAKTGRLAGSGPLLAQISANTAPVPPVSGAVPDAARAQLGRLIKVSAKGTWQVVANVGDFDYAWTASHAYLDPNNPEWPDANPYGVLATPAGTYVADAGANTLDLVRPNGSTQVLAWFPNPAPAIFSDSVPTCVVKTRTGLMVGDLNGRLWRYVGSFVPQQVPLSGDHVTTIESCATDGDHIYVADIFTGQVASIDANGHVTSLATGLTWPGGIAIGPDHALYVSNFSVFAGSGQIVRVQIPAFRS